MKYDWIDKHCLAKKGVEKDYKSEWEATRYMIKGKMFAMQGNHKDGKPIITMKLEPTFGEFLRKQYKDIIPGYYMNKEHWNSVYLDGAVPEDVLEDMLNKSYLIILNSFSKKIQSELANA